MLQGARREEAQVLVELLLGFALAGPPSAGWHVLTEGDVVVSCTQSGAEPWCRASGLIAAPSDVVYTLLDDIGGHSKIFDRIAVSVEYAPGRAHQVVRLPFPLDSRDYVVRLTRTREGADRVITFDSISAPELPVQGLRLDHFAGEFRVHPRPDGTTEFSYLWQAELGPDVPSWALPVAWEAQGTEIVQGLRAAAESRQAGHPPR